MLLRTCFRDIFRAKAGDTNEGTSGGTAVADKPAAEKTGLDFMRDPDISSRASTDPSDDEAGEKDTDETADEKDKDEPLDEAAADYEEETFSDEVLERAIELGLTARDVRRFETERDLTRECDRIERLEQRVRAKEKDAPKGEKTPADEEKSSKAAALDTKLAELLAAGIDSETVGFLKDLKEFAAAGQEEAKQARKMLAELQEASDEMKQRVEQAEIARAIENKEKQFDSVIESLNEEYSGAFGKGPGYKLDQRSKEYKVRSETWLRAIGIEKAYIESGRRPPQFDQCVREAAAGVFAGRSTEVARTKLKEDIKKAGSQTMVRSRSNHKELTGEALARAQDREFWEKNR